MAVPRSTGNGSSGGDQLPAEGSSVINNVVYLDGRHAASPATLSGTFQLLEQQPDSMAWIGLYRPAEAELMAAATELGLHELAIEDAITAHQRPKLERYRPVTTRSRRTSRWASGSADTAGQGSELLTSAPRPVGPC